MKNNKTLKILGIPLIIVVFLGFFLISKDLGYIILGVLAIIAFLIIMRKSDLNCLVQYLNNCDPSGFIRESGALFNKYANKKTTISLLNNNLAIAYFDNGESDKAIEILKSIPLNETKVTLENIVVHYNLGSITLKAEQAEVAMLHYEKIKSYRSFTNKKRILSLIDNTISRLDADFAIEQGHYEQALGFYQTRFQKATTQSEKVHSKFQMARIYEKTGETDKQRQCLEYVSNNGKHIYIANIARNKLSALN